MNTLDPTRTKDVNAVVGGYLRDLAYAQVTQPQMFGYKRAAAAIWTIGRLMAWIAEPTREAADAHLFTTERFHHQ